MDNSGLKRAHEPAEEEADLKKTRLDPDLELYTGARQIPLLLTDNYDELY